MGDVRGRAANRPRRVRIRRVVNPDLLGDRLHGPRNRGLLDDVFLPVDADDLHQRAEGVEGVVGRRRVVDQFQPGERRQRLNPGRREIGAGPREVVDGVLR